MLEDAETFYKKYITRELESNESIPAFDIGTYYHTAILEPHLLDKECAVFTGKVRRGKMWEDFKAEHEGKAIITQKEWEQANNLIVATQKSELAMSLHAGGEAEVSLGIEVFCDGKDIYSKGHKLDIKKGWIPVEEMPEAKPVRLKVRCDYINLDGGYIADLKSTTGNAKDVNKTRNKISSYNYDLSAALYIDLFNAYHIEKGVDPNQIKTFWWVFASKDYCNCQPYFAGVGLDGEIEESNIQVGRAKWRKAVLDISKYQELGWDIPEEPVALAAQPWELEWVEKGSTKKTTKFNNNKTKVKLSTKQEDLL